MKKQPMTEIEIKAFAESVFSYHHKHEEVDLTKDVAFYILDLLRQGFAVTGLVRKLKNLQALAKQDLDNERYVASIEKFSLAIRNPHSKSIRQWVSFHTQNKEGAKIA